MVYREIFDGFRSYYAGYESKRAAAGYHAAMTMSLIFCLNVGSILILSDHFMNGSQRWTTELFGNKWLLLLIGIGIGYLHVMFGKRTGRYDHTGPASSSSWKRYLGVYATSSVIMFLCAIIVLLLK